MKKYLFKVITILIASLQCNAQLWTTDNVIVTVQPGVTVTVQGDIQNQNLGRFDNNGTIELSGNWIHNSANNCFGTTTGTVSLNGVNQTIGGTNTTAFNNLQLNGTGTKTLLINTIVGGAYVTPVGVLSLGTRNLDLNTRTLTVANAGTGAITRTTGFIISETPPASGYGNIQWNIGTGTGSYVFPFGNATTSNYLPLTINITTAGVGATGNIMAATYPTTTNVTPNNRPLPPPVPSTIQLWSGLENSQSLNDRWWPMTSANYGTLPLSTMTFTYRDSEWDGSGGSTNTITEANLGAQRHNGVAGWVQAPAGTCNTSANTVSITGVNAYNVAWVLVEKDQPLPIELLAFDAILNSEKKTDITWTVASEDDVLYYDVERSRDNYTFSFLEKVNAKGNAKSTTNYATIDFSPYLGLTYYRLKIHKTDGSIKYSNVRVVNLTTNAIMAINLYPNPASDNTTLHITVLKEEMITNDFRIEFVDMLGKVVAAQAVQREHLIKDKTLVLNLQSLAPAAYMIRITDGASTLHSVKLLVQR
ncbi:MAG: T9SS type A sorting domain-containing protein [Bacteroidetes bacterium]|nr:T9SS type A sorting domain-containing protein [Bacteroidota bacterium]